MRYARKRLLVALVVGLCVGTSMLAQAPTTYRTLDVGEGGRVVRSSAPLPVCFIINNDALITGTYCVARDGEPRAHNWTSYAVEPSLPHTGLFTVQVVPALPDLIFAEDFEGGDESLWPGGRWSRVVGHWRDPHMIRGGHWYPVGHLHSAAGNDYLVSTVMGDSVSTDTPATTPYRPYLQPSVVVDWTAYDLSNGWLDVGGVVNHREVVFTASNYEDPYTHEKPLDDFHGETFAGEEFILYAVDPVNRPGGVGLDCGEIADGQILFRGTVIDSSFSGGADEQFTWTVREQTTSTLDVPIAPDSSVYEGLGRGVAVEDGGSFGSGARITRADVAGLRSTGDQWWAWTFYRTGDASATTTFTIFDSPLCRIVRDPLGPNGFWTVQLRNAAGTWQTVYGDLAFSQVTLYHVLVNYDTGTSTASLYSDGVLQGSTVITSGLYSASSQATEFYANPNAGTAGIVWLFFRHGTRELATTKEIEDRSIYAFDYEFESNLDTALEFIDGAGTIVTDMASAANGTGTNAVITSFADANGSWVESDRGDRSFARSRPLVYIGRPYNAQVQLVGPSKGHYTPGYSGVSNQALRYVAADGARLKITDDPGLATCTFKATDKSVEGFPLAEEPGAGQTLTWTGTSDATNDGNHVIDRLVIDPRTSDPVAGSTTGVAVLNAAPTGGTSIAGTWTTTGTTDWQSVTKAYMTDGWVVAEVLNNLSDNMSVGLSGLTSGVEDRPLATQAYLDLGPEFTPSTTENMGTRDLNSFGWQGPGDELASAVIHRLAKVTPSTNNGPAVVFLTAAETMTTAGLQTAPSTAAFTLDDRQIAAATEKVRPATYDSVRVRYAKNWTPYNGGGQGATPLSDPFSQDVAIEWRDVTSGSGSRELVVDSYFLRLDDAQAYANTLNTIITTGRIFTIQVYGPITKALAAAEPFDIFSITWSADSFLSSGRKGTLVGWSVDSNNNSATATVLFIP